jgi:hypothetical protein
MDADWSVELGAEDPTLEFPWSSPDQPLAYIDLVDSPESLRRVDEGARYAELGQFLRTLNSPSSPWLTAKCDIWLDEELGEAEQVYGLKLKLSSYVDLIRRGEKARFSFEQHERWVKLAVRALSTPDDLPAACEFTVRRCWYHTQPIRRYQKNSGTDDDLAPGYYITFYLFGYGNDEAQARKRWREGLWRVTSTLSNLV